MADNTRADHEQMTVADLCQAIENGRVDYTVRDGYVRVKRSAARRLRLDVDTAILDILADASPEMTRAEYPA